MFWGTCCDSCVMLSIFEQGWKGQDACCCSWNNGQLKQEGKGIKTGDDALWERRMEATCQAAGMSLHNDRITEIHQNQ